MKGLTVAVVVVDTAVVGQEVHRVVRCEVLGMPGYEL